MTTAASVSPRIRGQLEREGLEHLWRHFPQHCLVLTDPQTRKVVDLGIGRALRCGFHTVPDVRAWLSLMVFLGSYFDEDPQYPWAAEILRAHANVPRSDAMDALYGHMVRFLRETAGPKGENYRAALVWVRAQSYESLEDLHGGAPRDAVRRGLESLYSARYLATPAEIVRELMDAAASTARRHGLTGKTGLMVYIGLMFLLGTHIDQDPLHPWVGAILRDKSLSAPDAKSRALHAEGIRQLRRYILLDWFGRKDRVDGLL